MGNNRIYLNKTKYDCYSYMNVYVGGIMFIYWLNKLCAVAGGMKYFMLLSVEGSW